MRDLLLMIAISSGLGACATQAGLSQEQRPKTWAQPVVSEDLPNLHQVTPSFFRSAQPLAQGLNQINQNRSFKTIVSLRAGAPDAAIVPPTGVKYEQIEFDTWRVKDEDVVRFLHIATAPENQPFLLHCKHGADRTGMMTAIYRIVVQNWSKQEAIAEMRLGGFGYHPIWFNLPKYIESLDVEALRAQLKR